MNATARSPDFAGQLLRHEPMAKHTSWRVGGPADMLFKPASVDDIALLLEHTDPELPVVWLGLGSNLLIRDGGIRGVVIATHGVLKGLERVGDFAVRAEAGVPCARLAKQCARWRLGPAQFFAGIPGTLGGALAMNAGAFGGETWDRVIDVEVIDRRGTRHQRSFDEYDVGYRTVHGPADEWFLAARLRFDQEAKSGQEGIRQLLARRKASQPIGQPSCGSVFRNPPGDHAARLIETAGLKGYRIGGAEVSSKHANFIINTGTATAADVEALIVHVRGQVAKQHGVDLIPEVRIIGEAA